MTPHRLLVAMLIAGLALPASAQPINSPRVYSIEEIAADLAYGFCPRLLAGDFAFDAPVRQRN